MADLVPGAIPLLPLLNQIQEGAALHETTANLWARIQREASGRGLDIAHGTLMGMNQLRSWASTNVYATEAIAKAPDATSLNEGMIGRELYSSFGIVEGTQPLYNIRFRHVVIENGVEIDLWRTSQITGLLPPTKDQLAALMDSDAQQLADEYNQTHVSVDSISIRIGS